MYICLGVSIWEIFPVMVQEKGDRQVWQCFNYGANLPSFNLKLAASLILPIGLLQSFLPANDRF